MDHTKKMILVPSDVLQRIKNPDPVNITSQLDQEMRDILERNIPDNDKCILYNQVLQRYLNFKNNERQPLKISIQSDDPTTQEDSENIPLNTLTKNESLAHIILPKIAKKDRDNALKLIDIVSNSKSISWDGSGNVSILGQNLPEGRISELIIDCLRLKQRSKRPEGWVIFKRLLKEGGLEYVGNPLYTERPKENVLIEPKNKRKISNLDKHLNKKKDPALERWLEYKKL